MTGPYRVHVATGIAFSALLGVVVTFWQYPRLIVYLLLIAVAVLAYSALYLILASRLDPLERRASAEPEPPPRSPVEKPKQARRIKARSRATVEDER